MLLSQLTLQRLWERSWTLTETGGFQAHSSLRPVWTSRLASPEHTFQRQRFIVMRASDGEEMKPQWTSEPQEWQHSTPAKKCWTHTGGTTQIRARETSWNAEWTQPMRLHSSITGMTAPRVHPLADRNVSRGGKKKGKKESCRAITTTTPQPYPSQRTRLLQRMQAAYKFTTCILNSTQVHQLRHSPGIKIHSIRINQWAATLITNYTPKSPVGSSLPEQCSYNTAPSLHHQSITRPTASPQPPQAPDSDVIGLFSDCTANDRGWQGCHTNS